ncbi:MAG TPA: transport-associated protein [Porphyromonadaceae bacterium]|nr:transport-associated protein [Porphyromonadaceae bacterium]HBL34665.1 transport-associated protein [Porphyromonadaceae bacterium]HBX21480.1 transport-associated protein [Porphyromonadaceae bacterium]HCM22647.1 transport-associated protein [Porphyromonadaceae bacterium]
MKTFRLVSMVTLILALGMSATSCKKVSDADLQNTIQTALTTNPDAANVTVTVSEQVATLAGTVQDDTIKSNIESAVAAIKNVKSVVNNLEVVPPAPDYTALDASITEGLAAALKDHKTVTATVNNGVITIEGEIRERDLPTLMQKLSSLSPVQIVNNATVK